MAGLLREADLSNKQRHCLAAPAVAGTPAPGHVGAACSLKPHEAVQTVPVGAGQPHLCSIGLDTSSSPLAFALCGCHSYKISLSPIPPLHGGGAQTHFRPGQTLRSPQDCTGNTSLAPYFLEHSKGPISLTRMNDLDFILESVFTYSMPSSVTDTIRAGIISQAR